MRATKVEDDQVARFLETCGELVRLGPEHAIGAEHSEKRGRLSSPSARRRERSPSLAFAIYSESDGATRNFCSSASTRTESRAASAIRGCSVAARRGWLPHPAAIDQAEVVRLLLATAVVLLLAVPAAAEEVSPKLLVLQQADVPSGFQFDRDDSGLRSNEHEAKGNRRLRDLIRRWERVTGYEAEFDRHDASISSRAEVFRTPEGAGRLIAYVVAEMKKSGIRGLHRSPLRIGRDGWLYGGKDASSTFNLAFWRHGRVFAGVAAYGVTEASDGHSRACAAEEDRSRARLARCPLGLAVDAHSVGHPRDVVEVRDDWIAVRDRGIVEPVSAERIDVGLVDLGCEMRQLHREVAEGSLAR